MFIAAMRKLLGITRPGLTSEGPICLTPWLDGGETDNARVQEVETSDWQWMLGVDAQAKPLLTALGVIPDPTILYFLQLAEAALDDGAFSASKSRRRTLSVQLDHLKGMPEKSVLQWLSSDTDPFNLSDEPWDAAYEALDHIDCRMSASVQGYPPPSPRSLF